MVSKSRSNSPSNSRRNSDSKNNSNSNSKSISNKSRSKSSENWLKRQHSDPYTQKAKQQGYRSRAAFKLLEIQQKDKLIRKGMTVVELGAAPGGWSQVVLEILGESGQLIALDILPMDSLPGADIIQGDFQESSVLDVVMDRLKGRAVDLVISDMAPNISGIKAVDQSRSSYLAELAISFAEIVLREEGALLIKMFQGEGFDAVWSMLKEQFHQVVIRKPQSSRAESSEVYLLAKGFIPKDKRF